MHPAAPGRGDSDLAAIAAECDTAGIALHREFIGERRFRQKRGVAHAVQSQQRCCAAGLAFPLHREADEAVVPHRKVADGVLTKVLLQFDLLPGRSR